MWITVYHILWFITEEALPQHSFEQQQKKILCICILFIQAATANDKVQVSHLLLLFELTH